MATIDVAAFLGITPMVGKESLPNEAARVATNCRLEGGDLESWRAPLEVKTLTSIQPILSIYRYGIAMSSEVDFWFQWTTDVDVARGPIANDIEERTYWTGDGYPKKTRSDIATTAPPYPSNSYRIGIPIPAAAPIVTAIGVPTNPANDPSTSSLWGYTYVTTWDEEGPMSPLSNVLTWQPGEVPHLAGMSGAPGGAYTINRKRIYRSASGTSTTDMQFVAEIAVAVTTYDDTATVAQLGRICESRLWTPPPDDLAGLCVMANEIMCGFSGNTVRMSEPGVPYAWPERFSYAFDAPVVGIKPFGNSLLVCTKRGVHLLTGNDPANMGEDRIEAGVCVSKRGMVCMLDGVVYPTKMGLQYVGATGIRLLTATQFDEVTWAVYAPESFTAVCVNDRYVCSYNTGATQAGIVFSFVAPSAITPTTVYATAMWTEKATDNAYLVLAGSLQRWNSGAALQAVWRSKEFRFTKPVNMACARVEADVYPTTFKFYANNTLIHTENVVDQYAFPLPGDNEWTKLAFQYEGNTRLTRVSIATSMEELKGLASE